MQDLTGFQRDLLYVIAGMSDVDSDTDEGPKGLDVMNEIEAYYETDIHHGRLYPNLDTLVEKGLVDKGKMDQRTNSYNITRRGHRELQDREQWEQSYVGETIKA